MFFHVCFSVNRARKYYPNTRRIGVAYMDIVKKHYSKHTYVFIFLIFHICTIFCISFSLQFFCYFSELTTSWKAYSRRSLSGTIGDLLCTIWLQNAASVSAHFRWLPGGWSQRGWGGNWGLSGAVGNLFTGVFFFFLLKYGFWDKLASCSCIRRNLINQGCIYFIPMTFYSHDILMSLLDELAANRSTLYLALNAKRSTAFWYIDYWNFSFYDFKHRNPSLLIIHNSELIWKGNKGKEWKFK